MLLKGGFGVHGWDGPARDGAGRDPGMPGAVYDLYLVCGWKPRPAEWLFLNLGITPGLYSDLHTVTSEAFRLRGRAMAIIASSEQFQFVAGALYINRDAKKLITAGGFIWSSNEDTRLQIAPAARTTEDLFGDASCWILIGWL